MVKIERKDLTQAKVHEYFKYDDVLGELIWIEKRRKSTKYVAEIMVNKKKIHLGTFNTLDEAKLARTNAEYKYDFHINHGIDKPL